MIISIIRNGAVTYNFILCFPKVRKEGSCSGLGSRCLKILQSFEQPTNISVLPGFNEKVNITGISFHSFSRDHCVCMVCYVSGSSKFMAYI